MPDPSSSSDPAAAAPLPPALEGDAGHPHLARNARYGLWLFTVYVLLYAGFMALSAFRPQAMRTPVRLFGGVNLAVVYGFGLIVMAFVLAIIYMALCRRGANEAQSQPEGRR